MSTIIATNLPLDQVLMDVWNKADRWERIKFLRSLYPQCAAVTFLTGEPPGSILVRVSADEIFSGKAL